MKKYCYYGGEIVESDKVGIPLNDLSVMRGFAAFDFLRIYNGVPMHLNDHYDRFVNSANALGITLPISLDELGSTLDELCKRNECKDAHVRMIATGGTTYDGLTPGKPLVFIIFEDLVDLDDELFEKGAKLITHDHERFLPEAKTTSYAQAVMLQGAKKKSGAIEVLYISGDKVLEPTTSNIMFVKDGTIVTPSDKILHGLTKKVVLDLAREENMPVVEREVTMNELLDADEVFITATNKKVLPITVIDSSEINDGKVGEISKLLLKKFNNHIKEICYS